MTILWRTIVGLKLKIVTRVAIGFQPGYNHVNISATTNNNNNHYKRRMKDSVTFLSVCQCLLSRQIVFKVKNKEKKDCCKGKMTTFFIRRIKYLCHDWNQNLNALLPCCVDNIVIPVTSVSKCNQVCIMAKQKWKYGLVINAL